MNDMNDMILKLFKKWIKKKNFKNLVIQVIHILKRLITDELKKLKTNLNEYKIMELCRNI